MAFAAVASLSETINLILNHHHQSISPRFENQITSLHEHIVFLQSFFEDFPDETDDLEERTREAASDAEDIIELLLTDSLVKSTAGSSGLDSNSPICCDFDDLERVAEKIGSIAKGVKERRKEAAGGLDKDLREIIDRLCGSIERKTIAIVGTGGIGKTTLAKNAYNNRLVVNLFEFRSWVTISQDYSMRKIALGLLNSMKLLNFDHMSLSDHQLFEIVHKNLSDKRYLIVLDDVWALEVWYNFKFILPNNTNRSRIMLTTRDMNVAAKAVHMASKAPPQGHIHQMSLMDVDSSWYILKQKIFNHDRCPPKLEYIGKLIARSCSGIPLAIEVVSGILAANLTQAAWEDILENMENPIKCDCPDDSSHILCVSYAYLPHHLRACFLYLGMFPEDRQIDVSKVIKMWVAEGFLNESVSKSFEETGEEYLEELVKRNLISVSRRKSNGRIKCFHTHDLIRDLCIRKARQEQFFLYESQFNLQADPKEHQRRFIISEYDGRFYDNVYGSSIRTVFFKGRQEDLEGVLEYFRLLRILDPWSDHNFLRNCSLPDIVYELIHLRYLAFNYAVDFSEAISNLQNLQTLVILPTANEIQIVKLPVAIWRIRQLRHVLVHSCVLPSQEEEGAMFALENLQTLTKAENFICSRETLKMIPNLKKLTIAWAVIDEYCQLQNLILLQKLEILKINVYSSFVKWHSMSTPAFCPTLKELTLRGTKLPWEAMKMVGSLPNLQVLKLKSFACIGHTWETNEGGFSQLNFLLILKSNLARWFTETSHFPKLKRLLLPLCWNLKEVPNGIGEIPTLEFIGVDDRNNSLLKSAKWIQKEQKSLGNNTLEVGIVYRDPKFRNESMTRSRSVDKRFIF